MPNSTEMHGKGKLIDKCDALYVWHKDAIFSLALDAVGGNKEWALALLEECMLTAYKNIDKFGDEKSAETKSTMVAMLQSGINEIYGDVWRKLEAESRNCEKKVENLKVYYSKKDRADVDQILIRNELTAGLAKYVEQLTNDDKELIFLRFFVGFSGEELAKHFGVAPDEAEDRIFVLKQKIAKMMMER